MKFEPPSGISGRFPRWPCWQRYRRVRIAPARLFRGEDFFFRNIEKPQRLKTRGKARTAAWASALLCGGESAPEEQEDHAEE
jgi:hypothetical protein